MTRRTVLGSSLVCLLLLLVGCGLGGPPAPAFEVRLSGPRAEGDAIKVAQQDGAIIFFVTSESGIGRATIRPEDSDWPERIVFQFDLGGLESLEVTGEQIYRTERHDDGRKGGYRINLPAGITGTGRDPIEVNWIDFYRN